MSEERYFQMRDFDKALNSDVLKKSEGSPPWVKDHCGQLEDPEYLALTLAERGLLHDLRLLAARRGNRLVDDERVLVMQLRYTPRTRLVQKLRKLRALRFTEPYNIATNTAAKRLVESRGYLESFERQVGAEERREEGPPYPPNGTTTKVGKRKLRSLEALVRNTARDYPDPALQEELHKHGAPDALMPALLDLAAKVREGAAA